MNQPEHPDAQPPGDDAQWREAARLRAERRGWIVVWLAPEKCFRAYRRLPGARRDTALSAATAAEMDVLIGQAEQAAAGPVRGSGDVMSPRVPDPQTAEWMHAVAADLATAGMDAQVHDTRGVMDVTASLGLPGGKPIEVIAEDDGYCQVSFWHPPGATPAQVTVAITALVAVIIGQDVSVA
jgi:hypothetical protein